MKTTMKTTIYQPLFKRIFTIINGYLEHMDLSRFSGENSGLKPAEALWLPCVEGGKVIGVRRKKNLI